MKTIKYTCPKCGHKFYDIGQMRATTNLFTKLFNIQNAKFTSMTCKKCSYTEFYKTKSSKIANVFDFFTN